MFFSSIPSIFHRAAASARQQAFDLGACRRGFCGALMVWMLLNGAASAGVVSTGTWAQVVNPNPRYYNGTMLLLTDGSVMVHSTYDYQSWTKLTPDSTGNYVNGTWTTLAKMSTPRKNFGSIVLTDGRVLVLGGEFTGSSIYSSKGNDSNTGEVYDPTTNKWKAIAKFPETKFGAGPMALMNYGYVLAGSSTTADTYIYYPDYDFWTTFGGGFGGFGLNGDLKLRSDVNGKENWLLLPSYSVLSYDIYASITGSFATPATPPTAQRFSLYTDDWTDSGTIPLALTTIPNPPKPPQTTFQIPAIGPGTVLPNGKVIQIGGNQRTGIYTPSSSTGVGTWVNGPSLPTGMGAGSAPGAMLPDGHFLFLADSPPSLFDYDYVSNKLTNVTSKFPGYLYYPASYSRMLILPNGGMLFSANYGYYDLWQYTPTNLPSQTAWKPTISGSATKVSSSQYQLSGYNLTGISEGATYGGANARMSSNYPLVRLTKAGVVKYARTSGWSPGISSPTSSSYSSVYFDIPPGFKAGTYKLEVVTNGIASAPIAFSYTQPTATASFANGVLTITGDGNDDNVVVDYKQVFTSGILTSATVTVSAGDAYTLLNNGNSATFNVGTSRVVVNADMGAGNDTLTFNSLFASTMNIKLGDGNDSITFRYCTIKSPTSKNSLYLDGGLGTDVATYLGNAIYGQTILGFPPNP
jgi:hypothetical protein